MVTVAAGGSPVSRAMDLASETDPEETEYLACPTIADDSLAHQGVSDVGQGGRKSCDGLRRTPGIFPGGFLPLLLPRTHCALSRRNYTGSSQARDPFHHTTSGTDSGCIREDPIRGAIRARTLHTFCALASHYLRRVAPDKITADALILPHTNTHTHRQTDDGRTVPKSSCQIDDHLLINGDRPSGARPRTLDSFPTFSFASSSSACC